ncbi:hypothetical protein FOA43_000656 [Brettanomyces nanus]|uniref:Transmembrane protein n=1 Tax=Eeniella nana TaxID=13502 RepID=A0A875RWQ2_EENNA|nr:uncharacterized protein FOA43_000656 [Brettanomyces nanus]QPG73346.1 hypothetical protein FOA43_000656 [Brettanomyces nanus]
MTYHDVPVGYIPPPFPSLYWPLGPSKIMYKKSFLYYSKDVWRFTVCWCIIMIVAFYTSAAAIVILTHYRGTNYGINIKGTTWLDESRDTNNAGVPDLTRRKKQSLISSMVKSNKKFLLLVVLVYLVIAAFEGFVAGSLIGVLINAIYQSGQVKMTTWLPFVYSLVVVLFNITSSYSLTSTLM